MLKATTGDGWMDKWGKNKFILFYDPGNQINRNKLSEKKIEKEKMERKGESTTRITF